MEIGFGQFTEVGDEPRARALFTRYVKTVHIEISSYCNRRCAYCPVSQVDRLSKINYMENALFSKIVDELAEIKYAGSISLSLFNEPAHDQEYLLWRMRQIKRSLGNIKLYMNSNGDYINGEFLEALAHYGLNEINITLHLQRNAKFSMEKASRRFDEFEKRLGIPLRPRYVIPECHMESRFQHRGINGRVFTTNYAEVGQTRAGLVKEVALRGKREAPCQRPFEELPISWNGQVYPCCQMFSDSPEHKPYQAGNVGERSLAQIYASKLMAGFRLGLLRFGPKLSPCDVCTEGERSGSAEEIADREAAYQRVMERLHADSMATTPPP